MARHRLTDRKIATTKTPGHLADGGNLYIQIAEPRANKDGKEVIAKSWVFRYASPVFGRPREMGLGAYPAVSLADARLLASEQHTHLQRGDDPIEIRNAKRDRVKVEATKRKTFAECASEYIAAHSDTWSNDTHRRQWRQTLETYAFPVIGRLPVAAIELTHILQILEPIWRDKTPTASRLRGRIERILSWATVRGYRKGENPARWSGHLSEMLPAEGKLRKAEHHAAMSLTELPTFMADLRQVPSITAKALEFVILTAARTGEAIRARWEEVDLKERVWSIPGDRMKSGRPHRVPLSGRVIELLQSLPRDASGFIFPGASSGKPISDPSLRKLLSNKVGDDATVHGFRSTFSDWARDYTGYPRDVIEMALAHIIKDKSEAAYRRGDALEKRRRLMEEWARVCEAPATSATVTPLRRA